MNKKLLLLTLGVLVSSIAYGAENKAPWYYNDILEFPPHKIPDNIPNTPQDAKIRDGKRAIAQASLSIYGLTKEQQDIYKNALLVEETLKDIIKEHPQFSGPQHEKIRSILMQVFCKNYCLKRQSTNSIKIDKQLQQHGIKKEDRQIFISIVFTSKLAS